MTAQVRPEAFEPRAFSLFRLLVISTFRGLCKRSGDLNCLTINEVENGSLQNSHMALRK
jgi:hypothetical protein